MSQIITGADGIEYVVEPKADFSQADLRNLNLFQANLINADFSEATLMNTNLRKLPAG